MVGAVEGTSGSGGMTGGVRKVTEAVCVTFVTRTVTMVVPAELRVSVATATPFVVVRMVVFVPVSVNVPCPSSTEYSTAVPFATGWLFWVTFTVIWEVELISGVGFETVIV